MRYGNWVPVSKAFTKYLPKGRPYTELEAAFCMQVDFDNGNTVTVTGYADLWRWSKKRVYGFLDKLGVEIVYPDNTKKRQNQRGLIALLISDRKETEKRLIRFINSKDLEAKRNRKETEKRLISDRSRNATIDPNPNPDPKDKRYTSDSVEIGLSSLLLNLILSRNQKFKKPNLQIWAKHIDLAIRIDNRTPEELRAVIEWCQGDSFWQNNILSTEKLRQQFDKLWMQMKGEENGTNRHNNRPRSERDGDQENKAGKYAGVHRVISNE